MLCWSMVDVMWLVEIPDGGWNDLRARWVFLQLAFCISFQGDQVVMVMLEVGGVRKYFRCRLQCP